VMVTVVVQELVGTVVQGLVVMVGPELVVKVAQELVDVTCNLRQHCMSGSSRCCKDRNVHHQGKDCNSICRPTCSSNKI